MILRDNVRRLLGLGDAESGVGKLVDLGIPNGTAQRVLGGETSVGLDKIDHVARVLKVEAWQLLSPGLDPERPPTLERLTFRWPFRNVDPEIITGLAGTAAQAVEQGLLVALATSGISPRKRTGTNG